MHAAGDDPVDVDAARRVDGVQNRWFTEAALRGAYPEDVVEDFKAISDFSFVEDGDMETIHAPVDVLSVNYYSRFTVTGNGGATSASAAPTGRGFGVAGQRAHRVRLGRAPRHRHGLGRSQSAGLTAMP